MFLRIASILLILVPLASARVITWTAYSEESQAAADEEANENIDGVDASVASDGDCDELGGDEAGDADVSDEDASEGAEDAE